MAANGRRTFRVTIEIGVHDAGAAIRAARDNAHGQGIRKGVVRDQRDAVHWLMDPGESPPGMSIEQTGVEELRG